MSVNSKNITNQNIQDTISVRLLLSSRTDKNYELCVSQSYSLTPQQSQANTSRFCIDNEKLLAHIKPDHPALLLQARQVILEGCGGSWLQVLGRPVHHWSPKVQLTDSLQLSAARRRNGSGAAVRGCGLDWWFITERSGGEGLLTRGDGTL